MSEYFLNLFVTCPSGLEELLQAELLQLGVRETKLTVTGVLCEASVEQSYRICLWSRLANRVLLVLASVKSGDSEQLYNAAFDVDWGQHIGEAEPIRVDFAGQNHAIRHTLYGARVVKDAIVDQFISQGLKRPDVDLENPAHRINVRLTPKSLYIALDLSGESLHKRNYRLAKGSAPLKENIAAALLLRSKWPALSEAGADFVDPMCGSGTFLIEAAMMAADIAPGILRERYGFKHWLKYDDALWLKLVKEAEDRKAAGLEKLNQSFYGFEIDSNVSRQAVQNIRRAGLDHVCTVEKNTLSASTFTPNRKDSTGLILVNPPYGMRLGEVETLSEDYQSLAHTCKQRFPGWRMGMLSSNKALLGETRLRYEKKYRIYNGAIECEFRTYVLTAPERKSSDHSGTAERASVVVLSDSAEMVANRIAKNLKKLNAWRRKNNIECFRVYDADLPEYSAAIDLYKDKLHIQEYQAPKSIDRDKAHTRFNELIAAARKVFELDASKIYTKTRMRNKGAQQYEKRSELNRDEFFSVKEGEAELLVNLRSYLDTGLFLDHRPLRLRLASEAKGRSFLNLFSYTSSASVHAILGGATESMSVDMSNTYINWSRLNFDANHIRSDKHQIVRADVNEWLKTCRRGYDLIMLDPPSFSNSKKMDSVFDIQRDHIRLVTRCMELLNPGGVLYFSTNLRSFKLSDDLSDMYLIEDISSDTIDLDFKRNHKIHYCFKINSKIHK